MGRDITKCHPELQMLASRLIRECGKKGLTIKLGECFRTVAEQNRLYAQGRSEPGAIVTYAKGTDYGSMHQWGVAFDVIRNDGKGAYNNSDGWFNKVGKIGKNLGLEWGGDWTKPVDLPHFQLKYWGSTPAALKKLYSTPDNFKKTWQDVYITQKEEAEVVETGYINVNGRTIKIDKIVKNGRNFINLRGLENAGFKVDYNEDTKLPVLDNKIEDISISDKGEIKKAKAVNIRGSNYVKLRDFADIIGDIQVDHSDGIVILNRELSN